jgi:hypothetical protein
MPSERDAATAWQLLTGLRLASALLLLVMRVLECKHTTLLCFKESSTGCCVLAAAADVPAATALSSWATPARASPPGLCVTAKKDRKWSHFSANSE